MDTSVLPIVYLAVLVVLLAGSGLAIFRQILRTRKLETNLSRLQTKLMKEKGTAQEYYEFGSILLDKKLYTQAIAQFQKALKATTSEEENVAAIYNALGFTYFAQEQYDLAIRQYREAVKLAPDYVTALNNLGHVYEKKQLITAAVEVYEQALKADPNNATAKRRYESLKKRLIPST